MEIFVINLERSKQRLSQLSAQLKSLNLDYKRVAAVDGENLKPSEIAQCYSSSLNQKRYRRQLSVGEIGCYMSHIACWRKVAERELSMALILEDDAELSTDLVAILGTLMDIRCSWDLIKLCDPPKKKSYTVVLKLHEEFSLCQYKKIPARTTGYLISYEGALKLLAARKFFARPVDDDMQFYWEFSGQVLGVEPCPIWNSESGLLSDIDGINPRKKYKNIFSIFKAPLLKLIYESKLIYHNFRRKFN